MTDENPALLEEFHRRLEQLIGALKPSPHNAIQLICEYYCHYGSTPISTRVALGLTTANIVAIVMI